MRVGVVVYVGLMSLKTLVYVFQISIFYIFVFVWRNHFIYYYFHDLPYDIYNMQASIP